MTLDPSTSPPSLSAPWVRVMLVKDPPASYYPAIHSSQEVVNLSQDMLSLDREEFRVLLLNAKHRVMGVHTVSIGSLTVSIVHPREAYKAAILANAAAIDYGGVGFDFGCRDRLDNIAFHQYAVIFIEPVIGAVEDIDIFEQRLLGHFFLCENRP